MAAKSPRPHVPGMVYRIKEKQMPSKTIIAIVCITLLLIVALLKNIDGVLLASGITIIAGLGGYAAGKSHNK